MKIGGSQQKELCRARTPWVHLPSYSMIISPNRYKTSLCWQKIFNQYHRKIGAPPNLTLSEGAAFHAGVAKGLASKDWQAARVAAATSFNELSAKVLLLPEQEYQLKDFQDLIEAMIGEFEHAYKDDSYEVIQPECEFKVALPKSEHYCIWRHWIVQRPGMPLAEYFDENGGGPSAEDIEERVVLSPHSTPAEDCMCYQPHYLIGYTDALISKNNAIWLQDHKTTAKVDDNFWAQFYMDWAMTAYIYGIWKSTGILPHGFYINALFRPSEKQVASWNAKRKDPKTYQVVKDYVKFNREAFLRDEDDLKEFEQQAKNFGNEWEWRILQGGFPKKPTNFTCMQYNRRCDYYQMCLTHGKDRDGLVIIKPRKVEEREKVVENV